jgi:glutathione S-transferase
LFTIHHLGLSQSERVIWLCEELGIPYDLKLYARSPMRAPAEYKALHPMGMAPVITEDDLTLGESGAIIEYIIAKYGDGRLALKPDHKNFADYLYWFHFTNATLLPSVMSAMIAQVAGAPADGPLALAMNERLNLSYQSMEQWLSTHEYLAGEFTPPISTSSLH